MSMTSPAVSKPTAPNGFYCPLPVTPYNMEQRLKVMIKELQKSYDSLIDKEKQTTKVELDGSTYTKLAAALQDRYFEVLFMQQVAKRYMRKKSSNNCYGQLNEGSSAVKVPCERILKEGSTYLQNLSKLRISAWAAVPMPERNRVSSFWTPSSYSNPDWWREFE